MKIREIGTRLNAADEIVFHENRYYVVLGKKDRNEHCSEHYLQKVDAGQLANDIVCKDLTNLHRHSASDLVHALTGARLSEPPTSEVSEMPSDDKPPARA